ncbi:MAG: ATP-binding cassette domain-containing protein [Pseudomonadota bacterium]
MKQPHHTHAPVLLQVHGLDFSYPGRELFTSLSADIRSGVTLIQGGDGRGKTTLVRLLAGDLQAGAGQLQIKGLGLREQPLAYRQQLFWIDPRTEAFDQMTALDFFESRRAAYPAFDDGVLARLVDELDLAPHTHKQLFMLSTGSKRKVWMAAAFASGAAVTLLDMPFAALDKASIGFILEFLQDAAEHPERAWVLADYEAPADVRLAGVIGLGD